MDDEMANRMAEAPTGGGRGARLVRADAPPAGSGAVRSTGRTWSRVLPVGVIVLTSLVAGTGCGATATTAGSAPTSASSSSSVVGDPGPGQPSARDARAAGAAVIDVRTPDEFAAGHVDGATLIDVQAPGFDERIAELDPSATYVVYCRSGNRSAVAAERMRAAGLTVLDGGGLDDMTAAGWPVAP